MTTEEWEVIFPRRKKYMEEMIELYHCSIPTVARKWYMKEKRIRRYLSATEAWPLIFEGRMRLSPQQMG